MSDEREQKKNEAAVQSDTKDNAGEAPAPPETLEDGAERAENLDLTETQDLHSFLMKKKNSRHFVAHEEYGVLFSHCGIRIRRVDVVYDPPSKGSYEIICMKCLEHTKRMKAAALGKAPAE
jgi:hypothetical protein